MVLISIKIKAAQCAILRDPSAGACGVQPSSACWVPKAQKLITWVRAVVLCVHQFDIFGLLSGPTYIPSRRGKTPPELHQFMNVECFSWHSVQSEALEEFVDWSSMWDRIMGVWEYVHVENFRLSACITRKNKKVFLPWSSHPEPLKKFDIHLIAGVPFHQSFLCFWNNPKA